MARLYQKINNEAVPLGGGGGGSVDIDNITITKNSNDEIQVAPALTGKINQLNNVAADMGKVLTANGNGTAEWDDILVPIDYETITKNSDGELQVSSMPYDNTESGLTADNVQDAIDEVNGNLGNVRFGINGDGSYGYYKADDSFVPFSKSFYNAQLYTCGNVLPNRLSVGNISSYFTYDWEGSSEANNPSLCRITVNKRIKARVTFAITGRLAAQAVRRIFKHNTETLYDKTISENDFTVEKPGGIVLEDTFEQGDYFIIGVSYYTTAFKAVSLTIELI